MFLVGELGAWRFSCKNDCSAKPDFFIFVELQKSIIFGQNMIISFCLVSTNQIHFDSGLFIKLKTKA